MPKISLEDLNELLIREGYKQAFVGYDKTSGFLKKEGRRTIEWNVKSRLEKNLSKEFTHLVEKNVKNSFYMRHVYGYKLQKTKNGDIETFYNNPSFGSPWIKSIDEAEKWLEKRENFRLEQEEIESPDTGWIFIEFTEVSLKVIIDKKPLLGNGKLPDWLRNLYHGGNMNCLDTYEDNLCVWRCIAVHKGQNPKRCTQKARAFASGFFKSNKQEAVNCLEKVEQHLNQKKGFFRMVNLQSIRTRKNGKRDNMASDKSPNEKCERYNNNWCL